MKNPEDIDPDWGRYAETILCFPGETSFEVDLREPLTDQLRSALRERGLEKTFAVLTAHDPGGRNLGPAENRALQDSLEDSLQEAGISFIRVEACSIDRTHCECSVAIDVDRKVAVDFAKRFDQLAIFWFDGESFWLVGAKTANDPLILPRTA